LRVSCGQTRAWIAILFNPASQRSRPSRARHRDLRAPPASHRQADHTGDNLAAT
jgi:hypothetical protein